MRTQVEDRGGLVSELLGESASVVADVHRAVEKVGSRARTRTKLACHGVAWTCPDSPGLTYSCRTCAEDQAGSIDDIEAIVELVLVTVGEVFALEGKSWSTS